MATYNFTVRAQDDAGAFADREFSIEVQNTLVDRFLAVDDNHAYASVDGKVFEQRTGMGGQWCEYILNKWMIVDSVITHSSNAVNNTYSISDDTLVWESGLEFKLANDPAVYGVNEEGEEVILEEAGVLHGMNFNPLYDRYTIIGNEIYMVAAIGLRTDNGNPYFTTFSGNIGLVKSSDLKNWYYVKPELHVDGEVTGFGFSHDIWKIGDNSYSNGNMLSSISNVEYHNGQYIILVNSLGLQFFIVSNDLKRWEIVNYPGNSLAPLYHQNTQFIEANRLTRLQSINGILFITQTLRRIRNSGSGSGNRYSTFDVKRNYTIDLINISNPDVFTIVMPGVYTDSGMRRRVNMNASVYNNGNLLLLGHDGFYHQDRPTKGSVVNVGDHRLDATTFNGQLYTLGTGGNINRINTDLSVDENLVFSGLPTTGLVSIAAM